MGQNRVIGSRHVGVGSDHQANPTIKQMAHRHFFAARLTMHVDKNEIGAIAKGHIGDFSLDGGERVVQRVHE